MTGINWTGFTFTKACPTAFQKEIPETKTHWTPVLPAETGKHQRETTAWWSD